VVSAPTSLDNPLLGFSAVTGYQECSEHLLELWLRELELLLAQRRRWLVV